MSRYISTSIYWSFRTVFISIISAQPEKICVTFILLSLQSGSGNSVNSWRLLFLVGLTLDWRSCVMHTNNPGGHELVPPPWTISLAGSSCAAAIRLADAWVEIRKVENPPNQLTAIRWCHPVDARRWSCFILLWSGPSAHVKVKN